MSINEKMTALADEIRELSGTATPKSIDTMISDVDAANVEITGQSDLIAQIKGVVDSLPEAGGGANVTLQEKTITENGEYTPDEGYDGLSKVTVNVESGGGENKIPQVVSGTITEITEQDLAGATALKDYAFYKCASLTKAELPNTIMSIGTYAFGYCTALKEVNWVPHVDKIPAYCFINTDIRQMVIPEGVTSIGAYAFEGNTLLTDLTLPSTLTFLDGAAFTNVGANCKIHIPNLEFWLKLNITNQHSLSFSNGRRLYVNNEVVSDLSSVTSDSGLTAIKKYALCNATWLVDLVIPSWVLSIETYAFYYACKGTLNFAEGCTSIANNAFQRSEIQYLYLPASMSTIGSQAFANAATLTAVTFRGTPTTIASNAFSSTSRLKNIYVPWAEGQVANAPWGATNATIHYNSEV